MFGRFLVAIDGSESGEVAVDFATAIALQSSASVHVLFVNERLIAGRGLLLLTRAEATDLITEAVGRLRDAGVEATGSVRPGFHRQVASKISDEARERNADAIVLGSRRRRQLGRLFSSRTRERTTRLSSLPVLTAPSPLQVGKTIGRSDCEIDLRGQVDLEELLRISR